MLQSIILGTEQYQQILAAASLDMVAEAAPSGTPGQLNLAVRALFDIARDGLCWDMPTSSTLLHPSRPLHASFRGVITQFSCAMHDSLGAKMLSCGHERCLHECRVAVD